MCIILIVTKTDPTTTTEYIGSKLCQVLGQCRRAFKQASSEITNEQKTADCSVSFQPLGGFRPTFLDPQVPLDIGAFLLHNFSDFTVKNFKHDHDHFRSLLKMYVD